jgi:hypothetical protein
VPRAVDAAGRACELQRGVAVAVGLVHIDGTVRQGLDGRQVAEEGRGHELVRELLLLLQFLLENYCLAALVQDDPDARRRDHGRDRHLRGAALQHGHRYSC